MLKLGARQWEVLKTVCEANGGGVSATCFSPRLISRMFTKGLIEGMKGQPWKIVHTKRGYGIYHAMLQGEAQIINDKRGEQKCQD